MSCSGGKGRGRGRGKTANSGSVDGVVGVGSELTNELQNLSLSSTENGASLTNGHVNTNSVAAYSSSCGANNTHHLNSSSSSNSGSQHQTVTSSSSSSYNHNQPNAPHLNEFQMLLSSPFNSRPSILQSVTTNNPGCDSLKNQFKELVLELSTDPTLFDSLVPYLVESLNYPPVTDKDVYEDMVTTLVKWAILSESFRYTGSKLANYLALPGQVPFDFTSVFFESVTNECYNKLDRLIGCTTSSDHQQLEGIMLFMAELYLNMCIVTMDSTGQQIQSVTRIEFLKETLKLAILKILEKAHSDKPLETVGKVLKLTGSTLEEKSHSSSSAEMKSKVKEDQELNDRIFVHVEAISNLDYTSKTVKTLFKRVLVLRQNNWQSPETTSNNNSGGSINGGSTAATVGGNTNFANVNQNDSFLDYDVPVFYLTDGTPIPAHEADFVENDVRGTGVINSGERYMYLHGEGDIPDSHSHLNSNNADLSQLMSHTLTSEEEEAFNLFLSQMSSN